MQDVQAYGFDGKGGAVALPCDGVPLEQMVAQLVAPQGGFVWVNLNRNTDAGRAWLEQSGLNALAMEALTADETRPRCTVHGETVLMILRGVNLNPGAEPEDMVSVRLFMQAQAVVSVQLRPLTALDDVIEPIARGQGPATPGELLTRLALRLADRAEPVVAALNERIDDLEDREPGQSGAGMRGELADIRRISILLRRYMFPQRDALSTLEIEEQDWLTQHDRARLREATERVTRLAEELDAIRDRAQVVHDQVMDLRAEVMNKQMLVLSVVAAIFLPLGLLTGLLGINVGGIPGTNTPWAFWAVCALLLVICTFQMWLFRRMGLLGRSG
ncbi:zinc transporter ZntB [Thalassovita taeanensis]|uniref:Zinc transporter n=1 Tax=Thalassovita taeanensis TaxID=657014 RepID=A0A1H9FF05_9RHOB|nr:zinc transporter ZntB [Thalassovita taeanensis]SEQ36510.1 zinc transporter [Thalassovita taeanensis]